MTAQRLPSWAVEPIDMNGAAAALGVSRRTFIAILARHPHYELRGRKKVFYPEHIALIREGPQYKALGNSMAVPCIAWIMDRMRESMEHHQRRAA